MTRHATRALGALLVLSLLGCGGETPPAGETPPPGAPVSKAAAPAAVPDDADFVRARDVMKIVERYHARGGGFLDNARKGFAMHPERSRRGLLQVIERRSPGWTLAFAFLRRLPEGDDLKGRILKVFRSEEHGEGRSEAAWTLGHFGVSEAGPEIFAHLKTLDPKRDGVAFGETARGLAAVPPKEALPFVLEKIAARPLLPGSAVGPLAEALGRLDPQQALKLLPPLLEETWDVEGYRGVMRGLGATARPEGRDLLIAFVKRFYAMQDRGDFPSVRRYGDAFYEALGEIARFHDETAWPVVLTHDFPYSNGTRGAEARVKAASAAIPQAFLDRWVATWANWPGKDRLGKRFVILGEKILRERRDPKMRARILAGVRKFMSNPRYDGNLRQATVELTPWARAGDEEVLGLVRTIAGRSGFEAFSSREAAYQVLSQIQDPQYPSILVKNGDTGLGWNRIDHALTAPVPGLAELVMKTKYQGGFGKGGAPSKKVFEALGLEGNPKMLAHMMKEIEAAMAAPENSLLADWIRGLGYWKAETVGPTLRKLVAELEGKGVKLGMRHKRPYSGPAILQAGLYACRTALCQLGDATSLAIVRDVELETLPNMTDHVVPPCLRLYVDAYPGPFEADWPSLEEMKKRCRSF